MKRDQLSTYVEKQPSGGRDGLPFRGAPTALGSGVLMLMVGRGWRGEDANRPPHPSEPPTVTALGSGGLVLMVGRGWCGKDANRSPVPLRTSDLDDVGACRRRALPWPAGVNVHEQPHWRLVSLFGFRSNSVR